ncbi:MAG: hypothetical protein NC489_44690 [Ruminococcus flavefaciens]|nr:hypothetical protein [Ruminococcus flavefaciens]
MRSKTSYFNPTLFKKNLARFWPLWGGASALGALLPLYLLTELVRGGFSEDIQGLEVTLVYYSALTWAVPVISLFYAALCALAVWHYLYNPRSVGMYHSLPVTRKGLFITNFLSGMAMMLVPYAVTGGLVVLLSLVVRAFEPVGLLVTILGVLGDSFFYFAAATLIVFVTGNPFAFAAFYFIFHFLAFGAEWLFSELTTQFYVGVSQAYEGVVEFLSPTIYLVHRLDVNAEYERITTLSGWIENGDILSVTLVNGWLIAAYAAVGAVLLGCSWLLYQRRRSESAGDVVAVGWMKPIFRYGVALCAALTGGTLLYGLFFATPYYNAVRPAPFAFCMAVAGVVGYYIASMLLAKSLKVFRRSAKGVIITIAASAAICFAIAADPFGVESWIPDAGEVTAAELNLYYSHHNRNIYVDTGDPAIVQKLLDLHRAAVAEIDRSDDSEIDWDTRVQVRLGYQIDGHYTSRYYTFDHSDGQSEAVRLAAALATDPDIQTENIFGDVTPAETNSIAESRLTSGSIQGLYNPQTQMYGGVTLTLEQAQTLEAAIRRDIQAGNFGKTAFLTDYEEYQRSIYPADLYLDYSLTYRQDDIRSDRTRPANVYLTISTYCTETLKALDEIGVLDDTHRLLTEAEQNAIQQMMDEHLDYEDSYGSAVYPDSAIVYPGQVYDAAAIS